MLFHFIEYGEKTPQKKLHRAVTAGKDPALRRDAVFLFPRICRIPTVEGSMGSAASPLTESGNVVITNNAPELPKITASKVWLDENGDPIDAGSGLDGLEVKLTLYKGTSEAPAAEVKTGVVTRTVTGNGTATWYLLDEQADVSQYTVKETAVKIPGGDFLTINPSNNTNAFGGQVTGDSSNGFTVTNQLPKTEIEVTKQWKDGTSANADRVFEEAGTIDFTVWQKQGEKEPAVYTAYGQNGSETVSYDPSTGEWQTVNISDLPEYVYDSDSESWLAASYYVVETDPGEVEITYQKEGGNSSGAPADAAVGPDDTAGTITITNEDLLGEFKVIKVDKTDSDRKLPDAEFTMRKVRPESPFDYLEDASKAVVETTNADGEVEFTEIPAGYYEVKETKLPDGYINTGEEAFYIHVSNGTVNMVVKSSTGFENAQSADDGKFTFDEATETVWASVTVTNIPGAALPNTGGPGTRMFYLLGILFTGLAGAGLILKRRRKE